MKYTTVYPFTPNDIDAELVDGWIEACDCLGPFPDIEALTRLVDQAPQDAKRTTAYIYFEALLLTIETIT